MTPSPDRGAAGGAVHRAVAGWLREHAPTGPLVAGVSGGADSMAMALALAAAAPERTTVVTVDHVLQPGSAERAAAVVAQLTDPASLPAPLHAVLVERVVVGTDGGPEAAARAARHAALRAVAQQLGGAPVLLAHTLDDQAETVLLGLARGSGPRSVAGMRAWRPPFGRPLLAVRRADTENACRAAGLPWWDDPHNADPRFTRVRLRREVLPLLEQVLGGGAAAALARTAALLDDDLQALDAIAAALVPSTDALPLAPLHDQPAAVRRRVLRTWLQRRGATALTADHLLRLDAAVLRGAGAVLLPGGEDARCVDGALLLVPSER